MTLPNEPLVVAALKHPATMAELSLAQWDLLLREARSTHVLCRLAMLARQSGLEERIPAGPAAHFKAARTVAERHEVMVRWEVAELERALATVATPLVLLKGAAYLMAELPLAQGRLSSDLDILVARDKLPDVERALLDEGWRVAPINADDERYFRSWLHELPPLRHRRRKTLVDVHHSILPKTDRLRVEPERLFESAVALPNRRAMVLAPVDMALHCGAHLFRNGDFNHGLRDLADLHAIVTEHENDGQFFPRLTHRAKQLDLTIPCFWALRYASMVFGTRVPSDSQSEIEAWQPYWPRAAWMDRLVLRSLVPRVFDAPDRARRRAISLLAYWPVPRPSAMLNAVFWRKRFSKRKKNTRPRLLA